MAGCAPGTPATCDSAGNTYPSGIVYNNVNQNLTLGTGVVVNTSTTHGVWLQGSGSQTLNIADGVTIDTSGGWDGVLIGTAAFTGASNAVTINASGSSVKTVGDVAYGYELYGTGSIEVHAGGITANGNGSMGLYAESIGAITVTTGNVTAAGNNSSPYSVYGVYAKSTGTGANAGDVSIDTTAGAVSLTGVTAQSGGVNATSAGGKVTIKTAGVSVAGAGAVGVSGSGSGTDVSGAVMVDIDTTAGTVSLTGATSGPGVYASSFGAISVKTGNVQVAGKWAGDGNLTSGIFASSFGSGAAGKVVVDSSAGDVTLTGTTSNFWGVFAGSSGGAVEVTTANVSTKAASSTGVQAQSNGTGAAGAVSVTSTAGLVKTEGAGAIGINALNSAAADGGLVTVHAGNVTTTGTGAAYGIQASSTSGGVTVTAGTINTSGNGAVGVKANAGGAIDVAATKIVTTGDNAYGFQASGSAAANVKVTVGEIQTGTVSTGVGAHGVNATGAGLVDVESIAGSKITTNGKGARGVNVDKLGGAVTVNVRSVETKGDNATGIHVYNGTLGGSGTGGAITITANSVVTTGETVKGTSNHYEVGNSPDGIDVFNVGSGDSGKITIDTSVGAVTGTLGSVSVSGRKARGIVAVSGRLVDAGGDLPDIPTGGGPIDIKTGTVTTTGDFGTAISAANYGTGANGAITINTLGTVSASGANLFYPSGDVENEGNYQPNGISAFSWGGGDVTITTKDVSSVGEAASAITAQSGNGDQYAGIGKVTINTTGGAVSAKGAGSSGIGVGGSSGEVKITTANVTTEGDFANAIQANNTGPNSAMTIDTTAGKIKTIGKNSTGISAGTGSNALNTKNAGLLKITAGDVETTGQNAVGIGANANDGAIEIEVKGALTTGLTGGDGVQVSADGTTTAKVTVTGSIVTQATAADGIQILGSGGAANSAIVIVNGEINAPGTSAAGILAGTGSPNITVNADGKVTGGKVGIRLEERSAATITNYGHITGTTGTAVEFVGNFASTFDNSGTVTGSVLLGGGDDTAILRTGSSISGNLDGQGGTADKLQLAGAGTASADVAKILNFEIGEKNDAGTWTLTGENASFLSTFSVNAGRLAVDGALGNTAFTVANGAVLGGNGTVGALTVNAGGKIAPGNSIDTLHASSAAFAAGAIYEVEINATTNDLLVVSGTATIDGTAQVAVLPETATYEDGHRYQILTAGPRSGTFSPTVIENSAFLDFALDQTIENEVWLTITLVADLPDVAETPNQIAAAGGIDEQGPGTPLFDAIIPLDADAARRAFDLASGEVHATVQGVMLDDARFVREALLARLDDAFGTAAGGAGADPAAAEPRYAGWAQAYGGNATAEGDGNAAAFSRSVGGVLAGFDIGEGGAWRFGAAAGVESAAIAIPDRNSTGRRDLTSVAAYAGLASGPWALRFGGAYGTGAVHTVRHVAFGAFDETLLADYGARVGQVFGEIGYRTAVGSVEIEPFAGLAHVAVSTDGFTETGGDAALGADGEHHAMTLASFGARFSAPLPIGHDVRLTALLAWQHAFGDTTPTKALAFAGGTPFTVAGVPAKRDRARVDVGLDWQISPRATLSLGYSGQFASGASDHAAKATFSLRF